MVIELYTKHGCKAEVVRKLNKAQILTIKERKFTSPTVDDILCANGIYY